MFDYREHHNLYHSFSILPQKDVLDMDITGTGCIPRFRRWWNDLFLLSYNCDRSRGFYSSSNALRAERFRQYRRYKHRIHPMSKFRTAWEFLILHAFVLNKLIFQCTSTFLFDKLPITLFYIGAFLEIIIIADLYVNLKTGYVNADTKQVILNTQQCLRNFCAKKLFLHVASAIPLHWFMFLKYGNNINCGLCKCNRYMCALKIISVFSLLRVIETSSYWCWRRGSQVMTCCFRFIRIGTVAIVTMVQLYDLADVVCLLVFMRQGHVVRTSTLGIKAGIKYSDSHTSIPNYNFLGFDLGRMVQSLHDFSFTFPLEVYYLDKMIAFTAYVTACIFYYWSLIECFKLVGIIFYPNHQRLKLKKKAMNFLQSNQLPNSMCAKATECFNYRSSAIKMTETRNVLYRALPETLKNEIRLKCYLNIILRIRLFSEWPVPVLENLSFMLQRKVYLSSEVVTVARTQGEGLMIVHDGILAVYSHFHKELGHLIDGDFFGAVSLVTDKEVGTSYVVATTNCTILLLRKGDFRKYMKDHPELFYSFKMNMKARYKTILKASFEDENTSSDLLY